MDPRLRGAVVAAAPKIAAAMLHKDGPQLERELRHLQRECGYIVARRALDAAVHSPEAIKQAIAVSGPDFAQEAATGKGREATAAALRFVESLLGSALKTTVGNGLRRAPISEAVREAFVAASPGGASAALQGDAYRARNVAGRLAEDLLQAKLAPHIRSRADFQGGLANAALSTAPAAAGALARGSKAAAARAVVEFVGRAGLVSVDQVANRFIRVHHEELFPAKDATRAVVKELIVREYLQRREYVLPTMRSLPEMVEAAQIPEPHLAVAAGLIAARPVWRQAWTHVVNVTPRAAADFAVPLPPDLRQAFLPHYLRTMDACLALEKRFAARGFEVLAITGENQLIREHFAGKVFRAGRVVPKFPDAQLRVQGPDGHTTVVNVEYVTKSYTPEMIREKAHSFTGPTVWAVDSAATAAKVAANTNPSADILHV